MGTPPLHKPHHTRGLRFLRILALGSASLAFVWIEYLTISYIPFFPQYGIGCGPSHNYSFLPLSSAGAAVLHYIQPVLAFPIGLAQQIVFRVEIQPQSWRAALLRFLYPLAPNDDYSMAIDLAWITALNLALQALIMLTVGLAVLRYQHTSSRHVSSA